MTITTQGLEVIRKELQKKRKSKRLWSKQISPDSVMRLPLSGKVPAVGLAEEDPTSVKVKYTLQQHFKAAVH